MRKSKIIEYPEAQHIAVCGDIHCNWNVMLRKLIEIYRFKNTLLIVVGDCEFGYYTEAQYRQYYEKNAGKLRKSNNWIAFVRGNHDNPAYFNDGKIAYKRFRTLPDYSIISACGHNILCIGGAISIDRQWRMREQEAYPLPETGLYWPDEAPVFSGETIGNIDVPIDTVVTHTAPSFCEPTSFEGIEGWASVDSELIGDMRQERKTMDHILAALQSKDMPLRNWIFGHFHSSWFADSDGIRYRMLNCLEFVELKDYTYDCIGRYY